ncbi:hypothetical protein C8J56DRAFT_955798 [Mycena floridula]|nr:hypothetical protein C8J56DRAFT_955798 [Mycena floridula]
MGSAASKTARKLPKTTALPRTTPAAWETRNEAIEKDAADPQFLNNLNKLGPVKVNHNMETFKTAWEKRQSLESLAQSEQEAAAPHMTRNRLHAMSVTNLLDERKAATTKRDLARLAEKYGIDASKLENLARFVSSPSVEAGSPTVGDERGPSAAAIWVDPRIR